MGAVARLARWPTMWALGLGPMFLLLQQQNASRAGWAPAQTSVEALCCWSCRTSTNIMPGTRAQSVCHKAYKYFGLWAHKWLRRTPPQNEAPEKKSLSCECLWFYGHGKIWASVRSFAQLNRAAISTMCRIPRKHRILFSLNIPKWRICQSLDFASYFCWLPAIEILIVYVCLPCFVLP